MACCRYCKGTGEVVLLQRRVPCDCKSTSTATIETNGSPQNDTKDIVSKILNGALFYHCLSKAAPYRVTHFTLVGSCYTLYFEHYYQGPNLPPRVLSAAKYPESDLFFYVDRKYWKLA